ncbi:hypothetical protein WR25_02072 [Diploscapter pachys]|uniref:Uncharacterized protein n=1 Tax=Diploscapter pachys TaxID=2018661 RepID=A0A2A2K6F7_9BILA|nr:hypothetical protein WR25_02072 [Diploscapter pachys]
MSFLSVMRFPNPSSPYVFINLYTSKDGSYLVNLVQIIIESKLFDHIDVIRVKDVENGDANIGWHWLRIVFRAPPEMSNTKIAEDALVNDLYTLLPIEGIPESFPQFKKVPNVYYRHGGNDPNDIFNMTKAEVENLCKVLHYTRVRNTAEFECSRHFKNEHKVGKGLPPIPRLREAAEKYGLLGGSWMIFPNRPPRNVELPPNETMKKKNDSKLYFTILLNAFFNSSLSNIPYARSVTMSVHGDQVVVRISNDDSEYLRSFNSWKEVNPDSETQLFFSRDRQVLTIYMYLKDLFKSARLRFKYKLDVVSFGGFRNMGREKSQIVCIYTNIEDRSSANGVSSSEQRGSRLPSSQFANEDSKGDNRSIRSSAMNGGSTFYSRHNSSSAALSGSAKFGANPSTSGTFNRATEGGFGNPRSEEIRFGRVTDDQRPSASEQEMQRYH